jgi:hypothetical protein
MNIPTVDQALAAGRHAVSFGMGVAASLGVVKLQGVDLSVVGTSFDHIFNGIKEISVGVAPLATIAMGWWAAHRSSPAAQVAAVNALPEVKAVVTTATPAGRALAQAVPSSTVVTEGSSQAAVLSAKA